MKKSFLLMCFLFYLFVLFYLLFFSQYRQSVGKLRSYNLIPFQTIGGYFHRFEGFSLTDQFVGNILAFVPFGFLLPLLLFKVKSFPILLGCTFILSFLVETAQLLLRVGAFDVDDLLLNSLGGVIGFLLLGYFRKLCCSVTSNGNG